jgi:hypothetical protein
MRSVIVRVSTYGLGLALMVGALATTLAAGTAPKAPEIDGSSIVTGLALASGAVLILRSRRRAK